MNRPTAHTIIQRRLAKLQAAQDQDDPTRARIEELEHVAMLLEADGSVEDAGLEPPAGLHPHRLKDNPAERRMSKAWKRRHAEVYGDMLGQLLDHRTGGKDTPSLTTRDRVVAATVIQWLGSPVGTSWLAEALGVAALRRMIRELTDDR